MYFISEGVGLYLTLFFINMDMGCNCSKDSTPLSLKQKLRREFKQKVADMKKIWNDSADGNKITSTKDELGFKPKE